ncbi:protein NYNRIN-like isoform X2 [Xyrichtys novacula]|uniref:Protein NYNRIN-like isoform X2 n=1 Tax=Xyrichtys novacula TaxID=13765 RepID=A0AAV1GXR6_XYRNO|nr:protein NYNRIN-like isoform X2 [Xyrichtys novacula]
MMKPKEIAIAKCAAHKGDMSRVTQGNRAADEAAKAVTGADKEGKVLLVTHEVDLEDKITLKDIVSMQEAASEIDKQLWRDRGATQDTTGLWRNHEGLMVAPPDLLGLMIQEAHGLAHVARGEVKRKIIKEYGCWAPYLLEQIDYVISKCTICLKNNVRKGVLVPPGYVPTPTGPMRELVVDFVDMMKPVGGKRYMLVVVDRFLRWPEACPTKRKDAQSVAKFLCREVISRWVLPDRISSDNGKEFVDKKVRLILQKHREVVIGHTNR